MVMVGAVVDEAGSAEEGQHAVSRAAPVPSPRRQGEAPSIAPRFQSHMSSRLLTEPLPKLAITQPGPHSAGGASCVLFVPDLELRRGG